MATLNVRGMKMVERRAAVYLSVRDLYYDVLFLQECHLENDKDVEFFFQKNGLWDHLFGEWGM